MTKRILNVLLLLLALGAGSATLFYHNEISEYLIGLFSDADERPIIAEAKQITGNAQFKLPKKLVYKKLREDQGLRYRDTIMTDANSSLEIHFKSGLALELEPNSLIVLEEPESGNGDDIVISFLQGNYRVIKDNGKLKVKKQIPVVKPAPISVPVEMAAPEVIPEPEPQLEPETSQEAFVPPAPIEQADKVIEKEKLEDLKQRMQKERQALREQKEILPDDYIVNSISRQRSFFNRCYAQHLRLNPRASGQMMLSFTIESTGDVSKVNVVKSSIKDPRLQKCTASVIERVKFRPFKGDPMLVTYPIQFE